MVEVLDKQRKQETPAPKLKVQQGENGTNHVSFKHPDATVAYAQLAAALGTADADFINSILSQLANATGKGSGADEDQLNFVLSILAGMAPRDRIEALLAVQMALVHLASMTFTKRLALVSMIPQQDSTSNALNKLMRTFTYAWRQGKWCTKAQQECLETRQLLVQ
jgi:hypothetical protein